MGKGFMGKTASSTLAAILAATIALAGCGGGNDSSGYTQRSIRTGFVKPADLGKGTIAFADTGVAGHIIYTPEDSVPTCPYVQRADTVSNGVQPAVELDGGNPTGRFIVGPPNPDRSPIPVVTQGAVVFKSTALAAAGMKKVTSAAARCPSAFSVFGGPPQIVGHYTVNSRPIAFEGWQGFAQQLAHTSPPDWHAEFYDDLDTVVVRKGNAILYAGFATVKKLGQRADSAATARKTLERTLSRLG
jgi:hypothetical protein